MAHPEDTLEQAAHLIAEADSLVVAAGAGMGVDSGMPDFRGNEGFWRTYPALGKAGLQFQQIASPDAFLANPRQAWGFYGHRLQLYRQLSPHPGFRLLREWGETRPQGYFVFTSNVDGHFQKAGFNPQRIHECHGSIHHLQCLTPCSSAIWPADSFIPQVDNEHCQLQNTPPACPLCQGLARPNILMFGDWGWHAERSEQQAAALDAWLGHIQKPVVIEIGAGTAIPSARHFSEQVARQYNGQVIRINVREPQINPRYGLGLAMGGLEALQAIASRMKPLD